MNGILWNIPLLIGVPESSAGSAGAGGQMVSLLVTFGLIIRPQSKKQKETQRMLESLKKGDRVVTAGGIRGQIHSIKEDTVVLKVDDTTKLELNRSAVSSVITGRESSGGAKDRARGKSAKGNPAPIEDKSGSDAGEEADREGET